MKLLIVGVAAISAGVLLAAKQSSEFVPTGSLLVLSSKPSGALTAAPIPGNGNPRSRAPIAVSLPETLTDSPVTAAHDRA